MIIAILGAPGCVGSHLIKELLKYPDYMLVGSFIKESEIPKDLKSKGILWKQVDLLDNRSAQNFLEGCEILIYLIHSLGAKNFIELDIQLAHGAAKAAKQVGIKKIIYLGGIIPDQRFSSPHLISRMMTGKALASYGIPTAEVRASILLETCSASYRIVYYLSKRLPIMITPRWLNSLCAPISLIDAVSFITELIKREIKGHEIFEIGSDIVRYRDLLSLCGKSIRGSRNIIIPIPFFAIKLSSLWIKLVTGVPNSVGTALAEGLRSDTIPSKNRFKEITGRDPLPLQVVLDDLARKMERM